MKEQKKVNMRTEQQMLDLILETARCDERIRAVIMNGSRVNPNAPRDPFQDFDIVYLVTDVAPFRHNLEWIRRFGELDDPADAGGDAGSSTGGQRLFCLSHAVHGWQPDRSGHIPVIPVDEVRDDSLAIVLLDKDRLFEPFPPPMKADTCPGRHHGKAVCRLLQ